jgi:chemotaxis protein MotB
MVRVSAGLIGAAAALALAAGCAPDGGSESNSMDMQVRRLQTERDTFRRRYEEERAKSVALAQHYDQAAAQRDLMRAELNNLQDRVATSEQASSEMQSLIEQRASQPLERPRIASRPLSSQLDQALLDLSAKFSDMVTYDRARGAVKLSNDLLFQSGSDIVRPTARPALEAFAAIAASADAQDYEVVVVGHSDDTPITKPETLERHPSNMHLSVHRAIAVGKDLSDAGVPASRIAVMGYGSNRPIGADKAANRRVEIFLSRGGDVRPLGG